MSRNCVRECSGKLDPRIIDGYKLARRKDIIFGLVMTRATHHVSPAIFYIGLCLVLPAIITARRVFLASHLQSFRSSVSSEPRKSIAYTSNECFFSRRETTRPSIVRRNFIDINIVQQL